VNRPESAADAATDIVIAAAAADRPLLVGVDVDGTLSPIVDRAGDARLLPGARAALERLNEREGVVVVVLSGRPLEELRTQFGLDGVARLVGSHGLEDSEGSPVRLTAAEVRRRRDVADELGEVASTVAGAWVEHKPAGAVLHVREASPADGDAALAHAEVRLGERSGVFLLPGHRVLEVAVRATNKAATIGRLRTEVGARTVIFIGDDASDEAVIGVLGSGDIGVRVGVDPSAAAHRLAGPAEVVAMLDALAVRLGTDRH
jgi:trehalose 6-phosphate phosphatase